MKILVGGGVVGMHLATSSHWGTQREATILNLIPLYFVVPTELLHAQIQRNVKRSLLTIRI